MNDQPSNCACADFERLTGASVNAYASKFLEADKTDIDRFVCKYCKTIWRRERSKEVSKASLVKLNSMNE